MTEARLQIGDYEVVILNDGVFETASDNLTHIHGPEAKQTTVDRWGKPTILMDVNCFLVRSPGVVTLIDAGCGTDWGPNFGKARILLQDNGVAPEDVRHVLLTHIHGDHTFGLFGVDKTPYFPNAEVWAPQDDINFYTDPAALEKTPESRRGNFKVAETLFEIYGSKVRAIPDGLVTDGIEHRHLPGHSPGHSGYLLRGNGRTLFIWGDALHVPEIQPADPNVGMIYDLDPATAAASRRSMLEEAERESWIVAGSHLTGFGHVTRDGDGWKIVAI